MSTATKYSQLCSENIPLTSTSRSKYLIIKTAVFISNMNVNYLYRNKGIFEYRSTSVE